MEIHHRSLIRCCDGEGSGDLRGIEKAFQELGITTTAFPSGCVCSVCTVHTKRRGSISCGEVVLCWYSSRGGVKPQWTDESNKNSKFAGADLAGAKFESLRLHHSGPRHAEKAIHARLTSQQPT
jgi:hypothetical protein